MHRIDADARLDGDERTQLRIAILFHHETVLVLVDELTYCVNKWKSAHAQKVRRQTGVGELLESFAHGQVATADGDHADRRAVAALDDRPRYVGRRGGVLLLQAVDDP